jgi:hypothetical protein
MISCYPHPNDPDYDHSDWERAVEQADWESRIEAHLRPPDDDDGPTDIWVCQGPPRCAFEGDQAVAAQQGGCQWCKVITVWPDGSETVREPSEC